MTKQEKKINCKTKVSTERTLKEKKSKPLRVIFAIRYYLSI